MEDLNPILACFQGAHSALNIAWPKPGAKAMSGAKAFLGTNVFKNLRKALETARSRIVSIPNSGLRVTLEGLNGDSITLLDRIEADNFQITTELFDSAVNLLYFSTGLMWHLAASHEPRVQALTGGPMPVEPFDWLCKSCRIDFSSNSPAEIAEQCKQLLHEAATRE